MSKSSNIPALSEEDVIKRRLLMDGDGTGDDRRINILLKKFIKWCRTKDSPTESKIMRDQLLGTIAQCEYAYLKSCIVRRKSLLELNNYEYLSEQIQGNIERAKNEIIGIKEEFEEAKKIRKNRLEYEELAKVIENQPNRKDTMEKVTKLHAELEMLEEKEKRLSAKLELRKKQFQVMVTTMQILKTFLDNTEDNSAGTSSDSVYSIYEDDTKESAQSTCGPKASPILMDIT